MVIQECILKEKCPACSGELDLKCTVFVNHVMGMQKTHTRRLAEVRVERKLRRF